MATTKLKPIKSTLAKAIAYITDIDKTAGGSLISSYGCGIGTADLQMQMTAQRGSGQGARIAYHLIQSFAPDDPITPEQAHQIGIEFAQQVLKGKYEFVVATHIDKDHIHNHIIYNATNFYNYKKYHYGVGECDRIRGISDNLCRANNLSVIENPSGIKGRDWYKYKRGKEEENWKAILKNDIDEVIEQAKSYEEFLQFMEQNKNYQIERRGSFLRFTPPGYERAFRLKERTLGVAYTEGAIRDRIEHPENSEKYKTIISNNEQVTSKNKKKKGYKTSSNRINLIVDISKNLKAQESEGYGQALVRSNINTLVKTMNFLINSKLNTLEDFKIYYEGKETEYVYTHSKMQYADDQLYELSERIKFLQNYKKYHNLCIAAQRAGTSSRFYKEHQNEIFLYQASKAYFDRNNEDPETLKLTDLFEQYKEIKQHRMSNEAEFRKIKKEFNELDIIRQNIEKALDIKVSSEESIDTRENKKKHNEIVQ